jgi:excinuclease ABC subunit C
MMEPEAPYSPDLERKAAGLPTQPGVYLHRDADGRILYVGKAKNLRNRVRAYFQDSRPVDAKTRVLMKKIADVEVIVTDTEAEALLLENNLIKEHQPRYNILLKDDKSYPYIRVTKEEFPRVFKTRRVVRDGSKYFGPYTDGTYLFYLIKTLRSIFPLRNCELPLTEQNIAEGRWKVCLEFHIKKCEGPCEALISRDQYSTYIKQAQQVLSGRTRELERQLETRMHSLADELRFEEAVVLRTRLAKLREYAAKQKVMSSDDADRDVFALARIGPTACTVVFTIRDGNLVGKRHFFISNSADRTDEELVRTTLERWYVEQEQVPPEVVLPVELEDADMITEYLRQKAERAVELVVPRIGDKRKLLGMAETNADYLLRELLLQQAQKDQSTPRSLLSLQRDLRLEHIPHRIECFDNSHLQGGEYVSSMVVFIDGKSKRSEYRTFKLKQTDGNDDFAAMREVIMRRYGGSLKDSPLPDLCIIDGGKGQVSAAMEALESLELLGRFAVIGLAKRLEEVIVPGVAEPTILPRASSSLRLLQRARDEAHRVAISYHRKLRDKRTLQTEVTGISGVGEKTATRLLVRFGSVAGIKAASQEDLAEEVGPVLAARIYEHYHA